MKNITCPHCEQIFEIDAAGYADIAKQVRSAETSDASRERIWFLLPRSVLISPLWQSTRKGCARDHEGKVLVEKREWTSARCEA